MAAKEQTIQLPVSQFKGLSLRPSIVNRDFNSAQLCSNLAKLVNGQGTIRPGARNNFFQYPTNSNQVLFPFTYTYHDIVTGSTTEELLALGMAMDGSYANQGTKLYKIVEQTLTITYSGTGTGTISITPEPESNDLPDWRVIVTTNGSDDINTEYITAAARNFGNLKDLVDAIHALSTYNCSPTTIPTSASLCFIDVFGSNVDLSFTNGTSNTLTYYDIVEIGAGVTCPKVFTDADFILPSALNYANNMYFAYGTYEHKYDGLAFYRSGLPKATINAIADAAGGTAFQIGDVFIYKLVYYRKDNRLNEIEGEDSDDTLAVATHTMVANKDISLTVNNLTASAYPNHNIKGAQVNGLQAAVTTITVDSGHTLIAGDTAYFYDTATSAYVERVLTGVTATTITFAGAVSVADNSLISNNVRIQIWRTKESGTDFYLVEEIVNDYDSATTVYTDDTADTALIEPFVEQTRKHSEPPKCSFIGTHQGLKITAGDPDSPNKVSWALPLDIEGYPLESNNSDVKTGGLGALTGFGTIGDEELAVFKDNGHSVLAGDFDALSVSEKDRSNTGIGCTSFRTLAHVGEKDALIGLSRHGVFIFNNGVPTLAIGDGIMPLFPEKQTKQVNGTPVPDSNWASYVASLANLSVELTLKRAVAINDDIKQLYHLYVPAEAGVPANQKTFVFMSSKYLVLDYGADVPFWTEYTFYNRFRGTSFANQGRNCGANAGFCLYKDKVWFGLYVRRTSGIIDAMLFSFNDDNDASDYVEAGFPVYLDIHYTPFTREINSATAFFKVLYINFCKFLRDLLADTESDEGLGSNFTFRIRTVKDYKNYPTPTYMTNAQKTFNVADGQTLVPVKAVTDKCRAFQVQLTNQDTLPQDFEQIKFDQIDLVYTTPYDPKQKDPKGVNG